MTYKAWIKQQLRQVEELANHPEPDLSDFDDLRTLIDEAARRAATAGLPDAVRACKIRRGPISTSIAREILAACLAAVPTTPPTDLLTIQDASQRFGISTRTLYKLCEANRLAHSRVGAGRGRIYLKPSDVERLLQQQPSTRDYLFS